MAAKSRAQPHRSADEHGVRTAGLYGPSLLDTVRAQHADAVDFFVTGKGLIQADQCLRGRVRVPGWNFLSPPGDGVHVGDCLRRVVSCLLCHPVPVVEGFYRQGGINRGQTGAMTVEEMHGNGRFPSLREFRPVGRDWRVQGRVLAASACPDHRSTASFPSMVVATVAPTSCCHAKFSANAPRTRRSRASHLP